MTPQAEVAVAFASALVDGDFVRAHAMLAQPLCQQFTPESLRERLYGMFQEYASGDPTRIHFDEELGEMNRCWPPELPSDLGTFYVSIEGDEFLEAVTVTVTDVCGVHLIRQIIWGRP